MVPKVLVYMFRYTEDLLSFHLDFSYQWFMFREEMREKLRQLHEENRQLRRMVEEGGVGGVGEGIGETGAAGGGGGGSGQQTEPLATMEDFDSEELKLGDVAYYNRWVSKLLRRKVFGLIVSTPLSYV